MNTPPASALEWATRALGPGSTVDSVTGLRDGRNPWLLRLTPGRAFQGSRPRSAVVLKIGRRDEREEMAAQVACLTFANEHVLPAPELIAYDLDGDAAEAPALLVSALDGSSAIPVEASTERLWRMGAAAATLNRIPAPSGGRLPLRTRPIPLDDYAELRRRTGVTTPLLRRADELAGTWAPEETGTVFVHGDFWQGNMLWSSDRFVGLVDWDCAGVGHYGVDLGSARLDAALMFGCPAAETVLRGWEDTMGAPARDLAWADLIAAVNQPTDLKDFEATIQGQGRADLTADRLNARREEFLDSAIQRLPAG